MGSKLEDLLGSESSFTNMTDTEKSYFIELLKEEMARRASSSKLEQIRPIVPIEQWIESIYYVGPDAEAIYPYWKEFIIDIFRSDRKPEEKINNVIITGSIGTGKSCLNEDTKIPTSIGLLSLKTLHSLYHEKGVRFNVLSESGIKPCIDVYDNGIADTKIIRFKSGREVEGTYNHKFRVIRDGKIEWVKFEDIKVGDSTLMSAKGYPFGKLHMNPDEAYTLGYMTGDGWCGKTKRKDSNGNFVYDAFCVMFQYENTDVARKITQAFYNWFGKKILKPHRVGKVSNGNRMVYLSGNNSKLNSKLASKLVNSGFGSGAENKGIPDFIFKCDKETISNFIQGLFDSDGTAEKDGYIYLGMKSKKCIYDVGRLLSMFGINYGIEVSNITFRGKDKGKFYQIHLVGTESYIKFEKEIGFNIDYKKERLHGKIEKSLNGNNRNNRMVIPFGSEELRRLDNENSLGSSGTVQNFIQFRNQPNYTLQQLRKLYKIMPEWVNNSEYLSYICNNDVYFDTVVSIENSRSHTYDLTVEEDHSYCFDGFISHNTISEIIMMRKMYELSCYHNVNAMYHLMSKTSIMFLYFSVNQRQAERTGFGEFRSFIDNSPYFNDNFKRNKRLNSLLVFPEGITFAYGSNSSDSIGMSVICSMLDEANFKAGNGNNTSGNADKALEMYAGIVNRSNSRFIIDGGINHSLNILVSSSTHENSATERQIELSKNDPHTIIASPSQWEVKPDKFSKKFFYVCKGTNYLEPMIVNSTDDINSFRLSEGLKKEKFVDNLTSFDEIDKEIKKLPPHMQEHFLKVPVDLRAGFEANIIRSLQDLGGVSTGSVGKLFTSPQVFDDCIDKNILHPFIQQEIVISTGDNLQIKDYLSPYFRLKHPERPRYIHIDQSYRTDSTGITSAYVFDVVTDDMGVKKPIFAVDFMLRINPPNPPRKIAIYKIRNFVVYLHTVLGMKIGKVTYDIFNSEESRQILEEMGFNVGYQSVDRTDKAYLDLVEIMYEGRLRIYDYPILRHELFNLIHDRARRKVDHPKTVSSTSYNGKGSSEGSKDVSDSLAGALESALQVSISEESGENSTLDDFLKINEYNEYFEPDAMTVEELVDRQIDDFIEEYEMSNGYQDYMMGNSLVGY